MLSYTYEDLSDALNAIVQGNATDEAYDVAARFGYYELCYGIIYRKENWMKITTAREILTRAKKDDIFDGEIPGTDAEVLAKAGEIVELAEQAWTSNVRGPEVEAILNLAKADQNGDAPEKSEESDTGDEHSAPEGTPSVFSGLPEKLSKEEPWAGYNDGSVKDVTEGIVWFAESDDSEQKDEILDILKNAWAYESEHKDRSRVLTFIKDAFVRYGGELGDVVVEEAPDEVEAEEVAEIAEEIQAEESAESETEAEPMVMPGMEPVEAEVEHKETPSAEAKLVEFVVAELARERVDGIPKPPQEQAPELPWNWADITDIQLHDLHMQYASLAYYKAYQRARDERIALHCKEAADEIRNKLLIAAPKYDEKNKEIKITVLEAQIASDPNIRRWRKTQAKYDRYTVQARHELDALQKLVEALSRLMTVRHEAWERQRR